MGMRRIGPFHLRDLEPIKSKLDEAGLKYKVTYDLDEAREGAESARKSTPLNMLVRGSIPSYDPKYAYLIVQETHRAKIGNRLADFGYVAPQVALEADEYLCPRCHASSRGAGTCSKCRVPFVNFDAYVAAERADDAKANTQFARFLLVGVAAIVAWYIYRVLHV